jgi:hypothetical protein
MIAALAITGIAGLACALAYLAAALEHARRVDATIALAGPTPGDMLLACENVCSEQTRVDDDLALVLSELAAARGWSGGRA